MRIREQKGLQRQWMGSDVGLKVPHCRRGPVLMDASVAESKWTSPGWGVWHVRH